MMSDLPYPNATVYYLFASLTCHTKLVVIVSGGLSEEDTSCRQEILESISVYGANYSIAMPMMVLSLNPTLSVLNRVPSSVLRALNIDMKNLCEMMFRKTAQKLVSRVLTSASKYIENFSHWRNNESINKHQAERNTEGRHVKFVSPCSDDPPSQPDSTEDEEFTSSYSLTLVTDEELAIRKLAQTLVRKVLHSACTSLDRLKPASSMEELITKTKKLKICCSPSHSPPLLEEIVTSCSNSQNEKSSLQVPLSYNTVNHFSIGSSGHLSQEQLMKKLGKKRQRSASHEANMEKDLEKLRLNFSRKLQLNSFENNANLIHDSIIEENPSSLSIESCLSAAPCYSSSLKPTESFDVRKMSIMDQGETVDEIENNGNGNDDEYVVLEAVTLPHEMHNDAVSITTDDNVISSNDNSHQSSTDNNNLSKQPLVQNLDYYVIIHSYPPSGECQKFLCNNTNEVNLIFHCWLFKNIPFHPAVSITEQLHMGLFEAKNVSPVHLDLLDAGIPFSCLEPRTVCIHDLCLSPENAQVQLPFTVSSFRSFFSVGIHHERKVITYHVLPTTEHVEEQLRLQLHKSNGSLSEFIRLLSMMHPDMGKSLYQFLQPFLLE